jgi:hypothetical protein
MIEHSSVKAMFYVCFLNERLWKVRRLNRPERMVVMGGIYAERNRKFREANHRSQHYECDCLVISNCFNL